jgi:hypothetical protein
MSEANVEIIRRHYEREAEAFRGGFELEALGDGTRLSTETRVQPTDTAARAFRPYWWAIRAGSGLIRRDVLRAVRRRAERDTTSAAVATQSP